MGDLGGYGIAELPPAGPLFARGPYRALGQKGNPWEVVRNSISAHVTHAEITHFYMFTTMIFCEEISISWAFWSGKNHFCLLRPVQNSFPISPENYFRNVCLLFANKSAVPTL